MSVIQLDKCKFNSKNEEVIELSKFLHIAIKNHLQPDGLFTENHKNSMNKLINKIKNLLDEVAIHATS